MQALLSFDQAPPFAAPLRFFLTAPLFGLLAGVLLLFFGMDVLSSRWSSAALAITHLLTLGFMLQIMLGALIQILPVVAGANLRMPGLLAALVHISLSLGTLALAGGFLFGVATLLHGGAALLFFAVLTFLLAAWQALRGVPSTSPTIAGIKLALLGLLGVLVLGVFLVFALSQGTRFSILALTDLHAAWGLAVWVGVLLVALAYVVVPMFQLTPGYPARASWFWPPAIIILLLLWTLALGFESVLFIRLVKALLAVLGMAFCWLTLRLQAKRRRAKVDATSAYWQQGLVAGILALLMLLAAAIWPVLAEHAAWPLVFAILLLVGGFISFMTGMLYKIVPFLAWLHLQNRGKGRVAAPTMNKLLADKAMLWQLQTQRCSLLLLLLAVFFPVWGGALAGLAVIASMSWLAFNLLHVVWRYRCLVREIDG